MIARGKAVLLAACCLMLGAAGQGQDSGPYVPDADMPDGVAILPPPPAPGSDAAKADSAIFWKTRALVGTPRWRIATDDVTNDPLERYGCAMGLRLDATKAPALAHLLDRMGTGPIVGRAKAYYQVKRPYLGTDAPVCEAKTAHLAGNGDYPSGHAANGWLEGLVLAQLLPARATAILARARAFGESRVVCGSHSWSAVQAGWTAGSVALATLQSSPAFQRDLAAASAELAAIRPGSFRPDSQRCAAEAHALAGRPW